MTDTIIIGGGVIGLSIAWELAGQGASVRVLEQGEIGGEASWAGAGILPPGNVHRAASPEARLRGLSHALWPAWSAELRERTGIDNGFHPCGGIELSLSGSPEQLEDEIAAWSAEGVEAEPLEPDRLFEREPAVSRDAAAAYRLPGLCQVRNPRHLKALAAGCAARGVELRPGSPVVRFERAGGRIVAAQTPGETHRAAQFCIACGAWSGTLCQEAGLKLPIEPVRGQIVMLSALPLPFTHVLQCGPRYLVPRADGRILVGSTEEWAGFDKRNTAGAVGELIAFAEDVVPSLARARFERAWSGLRPGSPDGLPYLGRVPELDNVFLAAGHFRSGLQLSPGTGRVMRQVILGQEPEVPLEGFAYDAEDRR